MKVISLLQPWATLVAIGAKRIETRSWATKYRGPLAIHASKGVKAFIKKLIWTEPFHTVLAKAGFKLCFGADWNLPLGKIIATCNLADVIPITPEFVASLSEQEKAFGDYTPGRFAWILEDVKKLPEPIPAKGQLGLWKFDLGGVTVEKPILFNTEMVKAILAGRKTMTRRLVKPQPWFESGYDYPYEDVLGIFWKKEKSYLNVGKLIKDLTANCPYQPGDILWVRETWCRNTDMHENAFEEALIPGYYFKADIAPDWANDREIVKWHPSIHMPRAAARLFLEVTNVRVERLQDISDSDAAKEGIEDLPFGNYAEFKALWDSIYSKRGFGWDKNPWLWVIEFKVKGVQANG